MEHDTGPQGATVQAALEELARRVPGLTYHEGARGHGLHPYLSGVVGGEGGARLEILRSVRWHEDGVALKLAAGPFGVWAKPLLPDVDHQEGGLTFLPDHREPAADGMLAAEPEGDRVLGTDPGTGTTIVVKNVRYGPYVTEQLPEPELDPSLSAAARKKALAAAPKTGPSPIAPTSRRHRCPRRVEHGSWTIGSR